jgi:hypothetical protein
MVHMLNPQYIIPSFLLPVSKIIEMAILDAIETLCREIAFFDRQRIAKLEQKELQPLQWDRGEILRALILANGGKMLAKEARQKMAVLSSQQVKLPPGKRHSGSVATLVVDEQRLQPVCSAGLANAWLANALITLLNRANAAAAITIHGITIITSFCTGFHAIAARWHSRAFACSIYTSCSSWTYKSACSAILVICKQVGLAAVVIVAIAAPVADRASWTAISVFALGGAMIIGAGSATCSAVTSICRFVYTNSTALIR